MNAMAARASTFREPSSMMSTAASACADLGLDHVQGPGRRRGRRIKLAAARAEDAMPEGTCLRCGIVGEHRNGPDQCIEALRDRLARFE
jgi:hypothetical protein